MKTRPVFVLLSVMILLQVATACSPSTQAVQGEGWVIFSADRARELGIGNLVATDGQTAEYWTPTEKDILVLESGLPFHLQENSDLFYTQGKPVWERLNEYNRQYVGVILDGRRIVYANYFCHSTGRDWRNDFVFVLDGGNCYFQFKYDWDIAEFFDLQVNGEG